MTVWTVFANSLGLFTKLDVNCQRISRTHDLRNCKWQYSLARQYGWANCHAFSKTHNLKEQFLINASYSHFINLNADRAFIVAFFMEYMTNRPPHFPALMSFHHKQQYVKLPTFNRKHKKWQHVVSKRCHGYVVNECQKTVYCFRTYPGFCHFFPKMISQHYFVINKRKRGIEGGYDTWQVVSGGYCG